MKDPHMTTLNQLLTQHCVAQKTALADPAVAELLPLLPGWSRRGEGLSKRFAFRNYYETLAFVNALAYLAHTQDHHPELTVTYNACVVVYNTHSVNDGKGGLSMNDFICAAKANAIHQSAAAPA